MENFATATNATATKDAAQNINSVLAALKANDGRLQDKKNDLNDLKKRNQNLKQALNTTVSKPGQKTSSKKGGNEGGKSPSKQRRKPVDLIAKLQDQGDMFTRKIEIEKRKIDDLQEKIDTLLAKSSDQRKKMGGINAARENQIAVNKRLKVLENKLDQSMIKYNESLSRNKSLREEINESRRQRMVYDAVYKRLEQELAGKKRKMAKIIADSNEAYEIRDSLLQELDELKTVMTDEQKSFETEWARLGNAISLETGGRDARKRELDRQKAEEEQESLRQVAAGEEQRLRRKVLSGAWKIAKEKAHLALSQERITAYEEAFAKILATTGINDIHVLVDKFIAAEEKNFSMFNYVNHLNEELEKLDISIGEVKNEIEKYRGQDNENNTQRKKILRELETRLARTEARVKDYDARHKDATYVLSEIKNQVLTVYDSIGCKSMGNVGVLHSSHGITDGNLMQYLGVIEQRTNEILQMYYATVQSHGSDVGGKQGIAADHSTENVGVSDILPMGDGPTVPSGTVELKIEPPKFEDYGPMPDAMMDDDRPLTRTELMKNAGKYAEINLKKSKRHQGMEEALHKLAI